MDWVDSTDDTVEAASALLQSFEVVRPVPTQATARQQGQTGKGKDKHQILLKENLLQAFPLVFPDESVEARALRQAAFHQCWSALSQHLEDVLEETNHATFQALLHFAARAHEAPSASNSFAHRSRIIPTAMTFAGGVNSADHAQTFPNLVNLLRQQGCYAAILQPSQLPMGKGVSSAVNSVLCQFSSLETDADDMLALQAWYQDVLTATSGSTGKPTPHRPPATPFGKLQLTTPIKTTRATATAAAARSVHDKSPDVSPGGGATSPLAKLGIHTPLNKLKGQLQPDSLQAPMQQLVASQRPLVVVVEEAEAVDTLTLQDLILVLSEAHAELPITLILGMATSAGALQQMLPVAAAGMLEAQHFQLASSMERFETLVREVLLGQRFPGVFFGHNVMRFINHQFMTHDFTTAVLRKGLQVACIAHFQHAPLSQLAPAMMCSAQGKDIARLLEAIPEAQFPMLRQQVLRSSQTEGACSHDDFRQQVTAELDSTCAAWSTWAVALRWINLAAAICEGNKPRLAHSLRVLYLDASSSKYAGSADKKHMLDQLCASLVKLPVDQCIAVLQGLSICAEQVWNGQAAMKEGMVHTQKLMEELKAGSPAKENHPHSQQPQAAATTGANPSTATGPSKPVLAASRRNAQRSSAANRKAAMRQQLESVKAKAQQAQQAKAAVSWQLTMAAKVADLLRSIVDQPLDHPPAATPGAAILCCGKAAASELQCLTAAPRMAVHQALSAPHNYLHTPYQISLSSKSDDACIAYQLFLEYGEAVDVADWFSGFCAIHGSSDSLPEEEQQAAAVKPKKRRGRPSKKVLQRDEPDSKSSPADASALGQQGPWAGRQSSAQQASTHEAKPGRSRLARQTGVADTAGPSGQQLAAPSTASGRSLRSRQSTAAHAAAAEPDEDAADESASQAGPRAKAEGQDAAGGALGGKSLEELAVRFSQATKELQVLGLLRPARKRRGDFAQKLVFHSGHADMHIGCEA